MFTLEPHNLGQSNETDRPQLAVMEPYLLPEPASSLWAGVIAVTLLDRFYRRRMVELRRAGAVCTKRSRRG
jgi:hypothetical protein